MQFLEKLKTVPRMALLLGLAGLLPFLMGGLGIWLPGLGDLRFALPLIVMAYAALIAGFLGGVRWGAAMQNAARGQNPEKLPRYLVMAIVPSLLGLVGMMLPLPQAFTLFITLFIAQAVVDVMAVESDDLADWYAPLRLLLTGVACAGMASLLAHALTH
jgi:F0F1-type ATP synthase membrane subunit c/vacuolar-type H+-ATPase subunit K